MPPAPGLRGPRFVVDMGLVVAGSPLERVARAIASGNTLFIRDAFARLVETRRCRTLLCAIARNEARYVEEWAAFHLAIGFDRIVIYDNDSDDGTAELMRRGRWPSAVEMRPWPRGERWSPQLEAYADCLARDGQLYDWIAFLDLDEFLNLKRHATLKSFLREHADADAIAINWRVFGSSGETTYRPAFVIERFTRAADRGCDLHRHVKTILRPRATEAVGLHSALLRPWARIVGPDGVERERAVDALQPHVDFSVAQVNHYFCKSREEFAAKRARGQAAISADRSDFIRPDHVFDGHDRNDVEDDGILRWLPATRRLLEDMTRSG